jgi:hypothetical protein
MGGVMNSVANVRTMTAKWGNCVEGAAYPYNNGILMAKPRPKNIAIIILQPKNINNNIATEEY